MVTIKDLLEFNKNHSHFNMLVEKYIKGEKSGDIEIVPFLGAGISAFCYPTWAKVLTMLNNSLGGDKKDKIRLLIDGDDYERDYEKAADMLSKKDESRFYKELREIFSYKQFAPFQFSVQKQAIGIMPCLFPSSIILTSNFDIVIETAYRSIRADEKSFEIVTNDIIDNPSLLSKINNKSAILHLHGTVFDKNDSIIFTGDSYARMYGEDTTLRKNLSHLFGTKSLLFLGSSLQKDRFIEIMIESYNNQKHFAITECDWGNQTTSDEREKELLEMGIFPIFYPQGKHECVKLLLNHLFDVLKANGIIEGQHGAKFYKKENFITRIDGANLKREVPETFTIQCNYYGKDGLETLAENSLSDVLEYSNGIIFARQTVETIARNILFLATCSHLNVIDESYRKRLINALKILSDKSKNEMVKVLYANGLAMVYEASFDKTVLRNVINELECACKAITTTQSSEDTKISTWMSYTHFLSHLSGVVAWDDDISECHNLVIEVSRMYEKYPIFEFALEYVDALHNEHLAELQFSNSIVTDRCIEIDGLLLALAKEYNMHEAMVNAYMRGLINEVTASDIDFAIERVNDLHSIYLATKTDLSATRYAEGLQCVAIKCNFNQAGYILNDLQILNKTYPNNPIVEQIFRSVYELFWWKMHDENNVLDSEDFRIGGTMIDRLRGNTTQY